MTRWPVYLLFVAFVVPASGCSGGAGGDPFGQARWRIGCPDGFSGMGCAIEERINVEGSSEEVSLRCSLAQLDDETYLLDFSVSGKGMASEGGSLRGNGIRFTEAGLEQCEIEFEENEISETYRVGSDACGPNNPTELQPCQVTNVGFDRESEGGPWIQGDILCRNVPGQSSRANRRDLTFSEPGREDQPARFVFTDCSGGVL